MLSGSSLGAQWELSGSSSQLRVFQKLLQKCHIKDVCTTAKNPQSNAVCDRMHQTVGNVLRILLHCNPPQNVANAAQYVDKAL